MPTSNAGNRHKVWALFQQLSKPPQDFDPSPATWVTKYEQPLAWRPARETEVEDADRMTAVDQATFVTRWQPDIATDWRIVIDDAKYPERPVFHILGAVDVNASRRYLTISAKRATVAEPLPGPVLWAWHTGRNYWFGDRPAAWLRTG